MPSASAPTPIHFTTGPTRLHPRVPAEIERALADGLPSWSHRSKDFRREVARCREALGALLTIPEGHRVLFTGSASEAMERIVAGVRPAGSLHLLNGAFARRFRDIAGALGTPTHEIEVEDGRGFGAEAVGAVESALEEHLDVELVTLTQNETSTGIRIPPGRVHELADLAHARRTLVAVDLVSGWPVEGVDPARIDAGFFSVQKLFGLPAGLGVVVASPELVERSRRMRASGRSVGGYFHLPALAEAADRNQTVATPNMLAIRLLGRIAEALLDEGIDTIRASTDRKAARLRAAIESRPGLANAGEPAARSRTIVVGEVDSDCAGGGADHLRGALLRSGFVVSDGYGPASGRQLRMANFPQHSESEVEALAEALKRC